MHQYTVKDYKNLDGKLNECITLQHLSGAGKTKEVMRHIVNNNNLFIKGIKGKGMSFHS